MRPTKSASDATALCCQLDVMDDVINALAIQTKRPPLVL